MTKHKLTPLADRFWARVEKGENCWEWTGATAVGYGYLGLGRREDGIAGAHRISWQLHYGEIPPGMDVCHHCDNRKCVRPDHLFLGTRRQNMQDASRKGRLATLPHHRKGGWPKGKPRNAPDTES